MKRSIWDWLAWVALAYILVWTILKMTGVINTSEWVMYSPVVAGIYFFGFQMSRLNMLDNRMKKMEGFVRETINKIHAIELNCVRNHGE